MEVYEAKFRSLADGSHCFNDSFYADSLEEAEEIANEMAGNDMYAEVHEGYWIH